MYGYGGQVWSDDRTKCVISQPKNVEGLQFLQDLVYKHEVAPSYAEVPPGQGTSTFMGRRAAMFMGGSWQFPTVVRDAPDLNLGGAPVPKGPAGRKALVGQCVWVMASNTKNPDAAYKLMKFLASKEALKPYWQRTWVAPPANLEVFNDDDIFFNIIGMEGHAPGIESPENAKELLGWMRDMINNGEFVNSYSHPWFDTLRFQYLMPGMDEVFGEQPGDVKSILTEIENAINKEMEEE